MGFGETFKIQAIAILPSTLCGTSGKRCQYLTLKGIMRKNIHFKNQVVEERNIILNGKECLFLIILILRDIQVSDLERVSLDAR